MWTKFGKISKKTTNHQRKKGKGRKKYIYAQPQYHHLKKQISAAQQQINKVPASK